MHDYRDEARRWVKDGVATPLAEGTAQGTEMIADMTTRAAKQTRRWADGLTGKRRTRMILLIVGILAVVGVVAFTARSKTRQNREDRQGSGERSVVRAS